MHEPPPLDPRKRFWIKDGTQVLPPLTYLELEKFQQDGKLTPKQLFGCSVEQPSDESAWFPLDEAPFLLFLAAANEYWYWLDEGFAEDYQEGPIIGDDLVTRFKQKSINAKTLVVHGLYTRRQLRRFSDSQLGKICQRDDERQRRGM